MNQFFEPGVSTYSVPGILNISGEDDHRRFMELLTRFPPMEQAFATRIASAMVPTPATIPAAAPTPMTHYLPQADVVQPQPINHQQHRPDAFSGQRFHRERPKHQLTFSQGVEKYLHFYNKHTETQTTRTGSDKLRLYVMLQEFLVKNHPQLGADPFAYEIDSSMISGFLQEQGQRPAKGSPALAADRKEKSGGKKQTVTPSAEKAEEGAEAEPPALSASTKLKIFSDLNHLFHHLHRIEKATLENPLLDLEGLSVAWGAQKREADVHYAPFDNRQLEKIFSPVDLLVNAREPDHFWAPHLGIHLGARLGEFVNRSIDDVGYIKEIDVWYLDIPVGKNNNSIRRLPITEGLIRLGFIDYVKHVRSLGGKFLFPHRNWSTPTAGKDPSKNTSQRFASYLDQIGLPDSNLVFHSFRHTVVGAMQDHGVPLSHAMQIVGHEAQELAVKTGKITAAQSRSVHLKVYTHVDLARLGVDYPILALKEALEKSIHPPIDYLLNATQN